MAAEKTAAVIGAGPAGLMAAEVLAQAGIKVSIHDRMPSAARKFLMAGRGGLNLTHSEPLEAFLNRYGAARQELEPAIRGFPPEAVSAWCEALGQPVFTGSSGRIFPKAMKASGLLRAWLRRLDQAGVTFHSKHRWTGWDADGALQFETPAGGRAALSPSVTILALGGASWPRLGSDGSWAAILKREGIAVTPFQPSNCGFEVAWSDFLRGRFAGKAVKRVALSLGGDIAKGDLVLTSYGIEGGAVYGISAPLREALGGGTPVELLCDLKPDLTEDQLASRLLHPRGSQSWANFLRKAAGLSPQAFALLRETNQAFPENPLALAAVIKAVPLKILKARGLERAISSAGGLAWASLDDSFMFKAKPGVFAAGEMLDWEAPTGGFLLQACFSTGRAAGLGAIKYLNGK